MSEQITPSITKVEQTLRSQRDHWQEISQRVAGLSGRELPPEPPRRILLFGVGSSYFASRLAGYALLRAKDRIRIPVVACNSAGVGLEVMPAKGDWAFAFSHRGKTPITLRALEACTRAGAFTVMVAGQGVGESDVSDVSKFLLPTCPMEEAESQTMSVTGAICAVTTLLLGDKAVEEWDAVRSIGEPNLELLRSRVGQGPSVLVGEWEGEWLAREGALKLMEMAKIPARAFGSEEFFHGPRASVGPKDALWHVSLPKDPRNADIRAAHRIDVFGATPLAWVPALVELQWLALAVALNRGENPDVTGPSTRTG